MRTEKLGQLLVDLGKITPETLEEALRVQAEAAAAGHPDLKLGQVLIRLGVPEQVVLGALAFQVGLTSCEIGARPPAPGALEHLGRASGSWPRRSPSRPAPTASSSPSPILRAWSGSSGTSGPAWLSP